MKTPNWKTCTEEELWHFVGFHLSKAGIESVLVGGAVVAVYSKGAYRSGDLDFIAQRESLPKVQTVLESLGFKKIRGRHYEHPECDHLIIEFPPGPISIGDDYKIEPIEGPNGQIANPGTEGLERERDCFEKAVTSCRSLPLCANCLKFEEHHHPLQFFQVVPAETLPPLSLTENFYRSSEFPNPVDAFSRLYVNNLG